jgi:hypothetical protein
VGGVLLDQRSDQAQQFLLLWTVASAQKGWEVLVFHVPSGRRISFVVDEQGT